MGKAPSLIDRILLKKRLPAVLIHMCRMKLLVIKLTTVIFLIKIDGNPLYCYDCAIQTEPQKIKTYGVRRLRTYNRRWNVELLFERLKNFRAIVQKK